MRLREYYERFHEFKCIYKEERQLQPQKAAKNSEESNNLYTFTKRLKEGLKV